MPDLFSGTFDPATASWPVQPSRAAPGNELGTAVQTNEPLHPAHIEALKQAGPAAKLAQVAALYQAGILLRMAGLRMTYPDWTDVRRELEARRSLRHAGTRIDVIGAALRKQKGYREPGAVQA